MSVYELLVGDIVQVETGEIISVDGIIFNNNKLYTDESSITGESKSIRKDDYATGVNNDSFLLSGSKVVEGTGMMIVLAVGVNSTEGKLRKGVQKESDFTPLQQKLAILADDIGEIGMKAGILTFGALALHLFYDLYTRDDLVTFSAYTLNALVDYFIIAVSIIVMVVPEGLPLAVTISLAYSVSKMKD